MSATSDPRIDATAARLLPVATAARTRAAVRELLAGQRRVLVLTVVVLMSGGVAVTAVPPLLGKVVDLVVEDGGHRELTTLGLLVALALGIRSLSAGLGHVLVARIGEQVLAGLRERVVRRALQTPIETVERAGSGDLVQRTGGDVAVVSEGARTALPVLVTAMLDVVLTLVGLAVLDWRLGLAGLAPLPIWVFATRWYLRRSGPRYAAERIADGVATGAMVDTLGGSQTVRDLRLQDRQLARVADSSASALATTMRTRTMQAQYGAVLNGAEGLGVVSLLLAGFLLVRADAVTVGAATAAALYFLRLFSPLMQLLYLLDEAQAAGAALARLVGVADLPPPPSPASPRTPADGSVTVRGVRHAYDDGPEVLHGIDLDLAPGERVALVGTSGAGKTTLGAIIAGVRSPTGGDLRVGGVTLADLSEPRRHVALVTQEVHVFAGTVAENLRLAKPQASDEELRAALRTVGAELELDAEPGQGADEASATRAQLIALARLVLADPDVAVLDEATAEAGSAGARTLERAAEAALAGRTALIIAHRLTQAAAADRVVVMEHGRVIESGPHEDLVAAGGAYARLWSAWRAPRDE